MEDEKLNAGTASVDQPQSARSAFEEGNPDFDSSKDCEEARGACYLQDIMANEKVKNS